MFDGSIISWGGGGYYTIAIIIVIIIVIIITKIIMLIIVIGFLQVLYVSCTLRFKPFFLVPGASTPPLPNPDLQP